MNSRRVRGAAAKTLVGWLLVVAAGAAIYHYTRPGTAEEAGGGGGPEGAPPPEVAVEVVEPRPVTLKTELPGRTAARLIAEIRPQVSGLIQQRLFTEGSDVKQGEVLYIIDPAPFEAEVAQAEANLTGARQAADRARAAIAAAEAAVRQRQAVLTLARTDLERIEQLASEGIVSQSERDKMVTEARVAEAALVSAEAELASQREAVGVAEAAIGQAQAALEAARIQLDHTRIVAPISGRIGISQVTVGALVTAHQATPLATIQQLDPIYVDVSQSTSELLALRRRLESAELTSDTATIDTVGLRLEDGSAYDHTGTLAFRDVTVDQSTGSVTLRAVFPNPEGLLLPGMFVHAIVTEGTRNDAILVSQQAVSRDPKGNPLALTVNAEGKVEQRMLTLDRAIGDQWLVTSGLARGDRVIIEGMQRVRPGAAVVVASDAGGETAAETRVSDSSVSSVYSGNGA
ncbi:MAG TPA: efflux RND transporter periplasmic adaptor subunit [Candidatus Sumerlaeota bacterium]|nr:efflux RND transporter periplasmic adaptor subunit [Candidatus Sumerlaeota bacterium]